MTAHVAAVPASGNLHSNRQVKNARQLYGILYYCDGTDAWESGDDSFNAR